MATQDDLPPTVGTLAEYSEAPFERRREWATEADVVRIEGPDRGHHMAVHPSYVEQVLFDDNDKFVKVSEYDRVFGDGVVSVYGDQWQSQRQAVTSGFTPARIGSYCETIQRIVAELVGEIEPGEPIEMRRLMTDVSMEVMLETLFGGVADDAEAVSRSAKQITNWFLERSTSGAVPEAVQSEFEAGMADLTDLIDRMIDRRDGSDSDLLSMLIAMGPDSDAGYTDERIRDEMITTLFAAHETTALTLTYTVYLLAGDAAAEATLRREVRSVADGVPNGDQLDELTYAEQVINEALRIYSPAHSLFRSATEDVQIGEYRIPEGDVMYLPQCVVHQDDRWWNDPDEFRPERFADGAGADRPRFAFFPFGAGPRRCLGESFARAEAQIVVAGLVDAFTFDRVTETFDQRAGLTAVPDRPIELIPRVTS